MVIEYFLLFIGLFLLIKSANSIVQGSSLLAKRLGVSTLIIGLTVVAFGTSLPELIINIFATLEGSGEVVFGNIMGSNIANILLVLGICAIIAPIKVKSRTVWKEIPIALLSSFVLFLLSTKILMKNGSLLFNKSDGLILLFLFAFFIYYVFNNVKKDKNIRSISKKVKESQTSIFLKLFFGLIGIYFGGKWVVEGGIFIATQLGLSEFLISATMIAIGTSLPELVVSVTSVLKGNTDLAVGNIVGSNIFNVLWVFGIIPFINPIKIPQFVGFDISLMFLSTLLFFIFMFVGSKHQIRRKGGIFFVVLYILYIVFLIWRG
tara:strand:+ start:1046 stop:2005 length:960 start_codon:yes stop_codon:yes gene_type:complete